VVWLVVVKVRAEVAWVGELLARHADEWEAARRRWEQVTDRREREVERAERKVVLATGRLGVEGWRRACERQRFRTVEDARSKAMAIRSRPAVQAALADLKRTEVEHGAAVSAAREELAVISRRMLSYGRLGVALTGRSREALVSFGKTGGG